MKKYRNSKEEKMGHTCVQNEEQEGRKGGREGGRKEGRKEKRKGGKERSVKHMHVCFFFPLPNLQEASWHFEIGMARTEAS